MRCGLVALASAPQTRRLPSRVGRMPTIERISVDLPTPLRPSRATVSPSPTVSDSPYRTWLSPYQACRFSTSSAGGLCIGASDIGFAHGGIFAHLGIGAFGDHLATRQHRDLVAARRDPRQKEFDHQDGVPV